MKSLVEWPKKQKKHVNWERWSRACQEPFKESRKTEKKTEDL
jgi:hypothetical protein